MKHGPLVNYFVKLGFDMHHKIVIHAQHWIRPLEHGVLEISACPIRVEGAYFGMPYCEGILM
jgi:hypothetical protein